MAICEMPYCKLTISEMQYCKIAICEMPYCKMTICEMPYCKMTFCITICKSTNEIELKVQRKCHINAIVMLHTLY